MLETRRLAVQIDSVILKRLRATIGVDISLEKSLENKHLNSSPQFGACTLLPTLVLTDL